MPIALRITVVGILGCCLSAPPQAGAEEKPAPRRIAVQAQRILDVRTGAFLTGGTVLIEDGPVRSEPVSRQVQIEGNRTNRGGDAMKPRSSRAAQHIVPSKGRWKVIASTIPGIIGDPPPKDNLAVVNTPFLTYRPTGNPDDVLATKFGLTAEGVWGAIRRADPTAGKNLGVQVPSGTYFSGQGDESNCPWSEGDFAVNGTTVQVPDGVLHRVLRLSHVVTGLLGTKDGKEQAFGLAAHGSTLFGIVVYPDAADGAQALGVYLAQARVQGRRRG